MTSLKKRLPNVPIALKTQAAKRKCGPRMGVNLAQAASNDNVAAQARRILARHGIRIGKICQTPSSGGGRRVRGRDRAAAPQPWLPESLRFPR